MAQDEASDLMMKFVLQGQPIAAEGKADLSLGDSSSNPLLNGFKPGYVFEVDRFTFRAGILDDDNTTQTAASGGVTGQTGSRTSTPQQVATGSAQRTRGGYKGWRTGRKMKYPADLQPVSFTRSIDASSSLLIQNCIDCITYDRASLIKRKSAGSQSAGEVFLRLDFIGVLVIGVDWSNDDEVEETCQFICRSVTISYRPQLPDGSLGAIVPGFWSMVPGEKIAPLA
jgi:type VI protein secretion system component Hcp